MGPVYQSDAYEALPGVLVNRGKGQLFQGNRGKKPNCEGEQRQYSVTGNIRKNPIWGEREQALSLDMEPVTSTTTPIVSLVTSPEGKMSRSIVSVRTATSTCVPNVTPSMEV